MVYVGGMYVERKFFFVIFDGFGLEKVMGIIFVQGMW
jgi:hypothetical protein